LGVGRRSNILYCLLNLLHIHTSIMWLEFKEYKITGSILETEWYYLDKPITHISGWFRHGADNGGLSNVYVDVYFVEPNDIGRIPIPRKHADVPIRDVYRRGEWIMKNRDSKIEELISYSE
jgi:hypothetical protein